MNRSIAFTVAATAALGLGLLPGAAFGQQKSLRDQLVGVWTLVSAEATSAAGARSQDFGASPKGILILDASGKYAMVQGRPDRPKFKNTGNLRGGASTEEFAAAARAFAANFGTWSVDEGDKILVRTYDIALIPNNDGLETKTAVTVAADELKMSATTANGVRVEAVYRRAKQAGQAGKISAPLRAKIAWGRSPNDRTCGGRANSSRGATSIRSALLPARSSGQVETGRRSMIRSFMTVAACSAALALSSVAFAQQQGATEAKAMLSKAVSAVKADKVKALDMFNKGEGGFLDRDLYPFCFNSGDGKIVAVANPNAKQIIGQDIRTLKDSTGKSFGAEQFTAAQKPEGELTEVSYLFSKPGADPTPVAKVAFTTKVGDLVCGVGYYK